MPPQSGVDRSSCCGKHSDERISLEGELKKEKRKIWLFLRLFSILFWKRPLHQSKQDKTSVLNTLKSCLLVNGVGFNPRGLIP